MGVQPDRRGLVPLRRRRAWGRQRVREVRVHRGCGYDKRSTAVSEALSKLDNDAKAALDRLVFEGGEKVWKEYVFDKRPVPHFSFGGKGISTFTGLFPYIGCSAEGRRRYAFPKFVIECDERSDIHDSYHVYLRRKI